MSIILRLRTTMIPVHRILWSSILLNYVILPCRQYYSNNHNESDSFYTEDMKTSITDCIYHYSIFFKRMSFYYIWLSWLSQTDNSE